MRGKDSLHGKGFRCNLFGYILQTIGLDLMVSMGPIETAENSLFVVNIRYTDQPMRLRNITPAALHL